MQRCGQSSAHSQSYVVSESAQGEEVEDRISNVKDFDRTLVLDDGTRLVARKVTQFLKESGDRFQKAIIFCVDREHAARMHQALVNENGDLVAENARDVMRITGGDGEGIAQIAIFIDPESKYPVLVTTSRLLSTGVDAQTCRLIVLDREAGSIPSSSRSSDAARACTKIRASTSSR